MGGLKEILTVFSRSRSGKQSPDAEHQALLGDGTAGLPSTSSNTPYYGQYSSSPERVGFRRAESSAHTLDRVPEEATPGEESSDDEGDELSYDAYRRFGLLYTFVPITAVLSVCLLALLRALVLPSPAGSSQQIFYDVLTSASFFSLGFTVMDEIIPQGCLPLPFLTNPIQTAAISTLCRFAVLQVTLSPSLGTWQDPLFARIWHMALGWASAEAIISIKQGYSTLSLYNPDDLSASLSMGEASLSLHEQIGMMNKLVAREDVEDLFGVPFIRIPIFILCLQRLNSVLFSLGTMLLLASHSATISVVFVLHLLLHTPMLLTTNRIAVHTVVYVASLGSLGVFFAALGVWHVV